MRRRSRGSGWDRPGTESTRLEGLRPTVLTDGILAGGLSLRIALGCIRRGGLSIRVRPRGRSARSATETGTFCTRQWKETMLIGYVSEERDVALADVLVEIAREPESLVVRSTPRGAIYADLPPGEYRFTLVKPGYGSKTVTAQIAAGKPYRFRLLSDRLLGYVWPKWVRAGEKGEFRVHSVEPYRLSLYRYGLQKEFVRLIGWY